MGRDLLLVLDYLLHHGSLFRIIMDALETWLWPISHSWKDTAHGRLKSALLLRAATNYYYYYYY